jgi:RNA polymerase sigma factor (sigma-70 family)
MEHQKKTTTCDLNPTRRSLISRLKRWDDQESWNDFFQIYWRLIYSTAIDVGLTKVEAEEVVQETVISVSKAMPDFKYDRERGSFRGWLRGLTSWRIKDQLRKRRDAESLDLATNLDGHVSELEQIWDREWNENLLNAALERVKRRVDTKQYQLFELYVIQEWPIRKIQSVLQVSAARIYLAKHRITALINKDIDHIKTKWY